MPTINLQRLEQPFTFARDEFGVIDVDSDLALRQLYEPLKAKLGLTARVPVSFKNAVSQRLRDEAEDFQSKHQGVDFVEATKRVGARKPWLMYFVVLDNYADNERSLDVQIEYKDPERAQ